MMEDAKAAAALGTKVVAVTMLTSLDDRDLRRTGVEGSAHDQVLRLAELSREIRSNPEAAASVVRSWMALPEKDSQKERPKAAA